MDFGIAKLEREDWVAETPTTDEYDQSITTQPRDFIPYLKGDHPEAWDVCSNSDGSGLVDKCWWWAKSEHPDGVDNTDIFQNKFVFRVDSGREDGGPFEVFNPTEGYYDNMLFITLYNRKYRMIEDLRGNPGGGVTPGNEFDINIPYDQTFYKADIDDIYFGVISNYKVGDWALQEAIRDGDNGVNLYSSVGSADVALRNINGERLQSGRTQMLYVARKAPFGRTKEWSTTALSPEPPDVSWAQEGWWSHAAKGAPARPSSSSPDPGTSGEETCTGTACPDDDQTDDNFFSFENTTFVVLLVVFIVMVVGGLAALSML